MPANPIEFHSSSTIDLGARDSRLPAALMFPRRFILLRAGLIGGWVALCAAITSPTLLAAESPGAAVDFSAQIRPLLSAKCFQCHGPDESARKAHLRLDSFEDATRELKGRHAIVPGDPNSSELVHRIGIHEGDDQMPPAETKNPIKPDEVALITRWIRQGAAYTPHWAWSPPRRAPLPPVQRRTWPRNGIDRFILSRLEAVGLEPAPAADARTLGRRVALDLTGLPLPPEELDRFARDLSPRAYEHLVDRLLESPHFGERWARIWLDLGRYADSAGYGSDPLRPNIWPWRDWLIGALNRNEPFDKFTRDVIAGDLVEPADDERRWATAFHRNTMTNTEGGTEDEEWRVAAVKDRANVTAQVWMGLTLGCAQCHSHKFDPITQRDYYSFYAFFNQTEDNDQPDERPTLPLYSPTEKRQRSELNSRIETLTARYRGTNAAFDAEWSAWADQAARPIDWFPIVPETVTSNATNSPAFTISTDGTVQAAGNSPLRDTDTITARIPRGGITAFRIETLPDPAQPGGGPGRRETNGAFALQNIHVAARSVVADRAPAVPARFVRVEIAGQPGSHRRVMLAEVQVWSGSTNVALRRPARQSSTGYLGDAARAVDGNTEGNLGRAQSVSHTGEEENPWWEVDLEREVAIDEVTLWNRTDGSSEALAGARVQLLSADRKPVWNTTLTEVPKPVAHLGPHTYTSLGLTHATATAAADGFAAEQAIAADHRSGWAPPPGASVSSLAFELKEPLPGAGPVELRLDLRQTVGNQRTLGRFRIWATRQAPPVRLWPTRIQTLLSATPEQRTPAEVAESKEFYKPLSTTLGPVARDIAATRAERESIQGTPVPVMREKPDADRRVTHVLFKGNYLAPGDTVEPATPRAFHPMPTNAPLNRLGLSAWLTAPNNPLTARVQVNRTWSALMGRGLMETEEDFGTQGTLPTHRDLLDWLAVSYQAPATSSSGDGSVEAPALGWNFKRLVRLIVLSATYRQSAVASPEGLERDSRNLLYGRANRRRLDAEGLRDQALALSGLLSRKIGGPSVYPEQPDGLWRAAFNGERTWKTSEGEDRYRRGIYTFWRRTVPYPGMAAFDAPSRESCTFRRVPTDTPLQAFVTLNDPVFVECAQALGRRLAAESGTLEDRLSAGYQWVTGHPPTSNQLKSLRHLFETERVRQHDQIPAATRLATEPLGPLPSGSDPADAAAWALIGNVLLNLDAVLTRG